MLEFTCPPATGGVGKFEWPKEIGSLPGASILFQCESNNMSYLFEVWTGGDDLVNEILHGEDVILSESSFDDSIVGERNALLVNLAVSAFVDQFAD